jgi:PAS domain S-box-containing protein
MLEFHSSAVPGPRAGLPGGVERRKRAGTARRLSADFCSALEAVSAPVLVHAGDETLFANSAMQRLLGYSLDELQAMPHYGWATAEHLGPLREYGERCLGDAGQLPSLECDALTASGAVRHLDIKARRLCGTDGTLAVVSCEDLSDMRHVQNSLLEMGRVMHQIIETDPVPTFVIDAEHRVTHWNAACARLSGVAATEMIGRSEAWRAFYDAPRPVLAELVADGRVQAESSALYADQVRASRALPDTYECEAFFPDLGGQGRWIYFTATPLRDIEGRIVGAIETLQDVTARRNAEERLRRNQAELENIVAQRTAELLLSNHELDAFLENASVGIVATRNWQIVRSNKNFVEMFELEPGMARGLDASHFFLSREEFAQFGALLQRTLAEGRSLTHEMLVRTAGNKQIWVQMIAYASNPADPDAPVWWLLQDRTEVMRAQEELVHNYRNIKETNRRLEEAQNQLLQSEKLASIGQLAAGVAHEINNPIGFVNSNLGSLRRYVEALLALVAAYGRHRDELADDTELARLEKAADLDYLAEDLPALLQESEDGLSRVKKIVQDLKDFSRVDSADWQDADINAGIESTLNVVMNEVKYRADVERRYGELPAVRCLAGQLNQVFMNLIVNAAHAMEGQRGLITLSSGVEARGGIDGVWIEVADTGKGMPPEVRRRIFEPFFTTKPVGQGTGLGLSLSFSIVQKHGGAIDVDSTPGAGTRFRVWVPVAGPGALPAAA